MSHRKEKIAYTKKSQKIYFIMMLVFALISGVLTWLVYLEPNVGSTMSVLITIGCIGFHLIEILFLTGFWDSVFYFGRLKMYGYCIEDTNFRKGALLKDIQRDETKKPNRKRSGESLTLAILTGAFSLGCVIFAVWKLIEYKEIGTADIGGAILILIPAVIWALVAWIYYKQSDDSKYRDDVELDETRKYRQQVVYGVLRALIWGYITLKWFDLVEMLFKYVQAAQENPDVVYVLRSLAELCII